MSDKKSSGKAGSEKLWGGRFKKSMAAEMERFSSSIDVDKRLWEQDIKASLAHARMLMESGLITPGELKAIEKGFKTIDREIRTGGFKYSDALEDIHLHIESRLTELVGEPGKKLHTARSRNDQVVTDLKLYMMDESARMGELIVDLERALISQAENNMDVILPGYTHLQRAQPVLAAFHLMAYVAMLERDRARLADCGNRMDELPLGSGALAGTSLPIDRKLTARLLGFSRISDNAMDAVASRDYVLEFLAVMAVLMTNLSRMAEDMILWAGQEFGFIEIDDAFCTGSSIMPQKKNPDAAELIRGCSARVIGALTSGLALMKGLPMAYNRDLQWDKEILFTALDHTKQCLVVASGLIRAISFNREAIAREMESDFLCATDLAEYLAQKGVAFREAHRIVGRIVAMAVEGNQNLRDLPLEVYKKASNAFDKDLYQRLDPGDSVRRKVSLGSTAAGEVKAHIRRVKKLIDKK